MNGALDEWLSHRSAKPSTAVRIRQAPHFGKISTTPADIFLFLFPTGIFSRCGLSGRLGRLGTPALDGVLAGVLAGVLDGAASSFYVFLLFIYPPNMVFIRNFPVFNRNIMGKGFPKESV